MKINKILKFYYLVYKRLRENFKRSTQFQFTLIPNCKWDLAMVRTLYMLWELAQMFSCTQVFNDHFTTSIRGRNYLTLLDFRVTGKF